MTRTYTRLLVAASAVALAGTAPSAAMAQDGAVTNPAVTYLMQRHGLSKDEATMRIDLQGQIVALSERLNTSGDVNYADMYIQHDPVFKIVVMFADRSDRKAFLDTLDPGLRRYVQLKQAKRSRALSDAELDTLNAAVVAVGVPFTSEYDLETERFVVTVADQAALAKVRAAIPPKLRSETTVEQGLIPQTEAVPSNVRAGDAAYGGNPVYSTTTSFDYYCSMGFAVNYTAGGVAKKGMLTAGHCPDTMYLDYAGRKVTLSGPFIDKADRDQSADADGLTDKYDYQIFDMTGITVGPTIRYVDKNSIPEFPASGSLTLTGITSFMNQKAGMVVCKSGHSTGITCGKIVNGNKSRDGVAGWIEVSQTNQADISEPGDSGGPWFLYPGSSSTITGVGIHSAGAGTGASSIAVYMPIDYINDHDPTVATIKQ